MNTISGVYKITNTITGDFYIGSSNNIKRRWKEHKIPSTLNKCPNNPLYLDMKKYGVDKFEFQVIAEVEPGQLKETEQEFIEKLKPTYNSNRAKGWDIERRKEYEKSDKRMESHRKASNKYRELHKEAILEQKKQYYESHKEKILDQNKQYYESHKEAISEQRKQYDNQLCYYNGETLTLGALRKRFQRQGIDHPTAEAKKYIIKDYSISPSS